MLGEPPLGDTSECLDPAGVGAGDLLIPGPAGGLGELGGFGDPGGFGPKLGGGGTTAGAFDR